MELDELNKLEQKVKNLVDTLQLLKTENQRLKKELETSQKESHSNREERNEIKKKVANLINLIDAIEKQQE